MAPRKSASGSRRRASFLEGAAIISLTAVADEGSADLFSPARSCSRFPVPLRLFVSYRRSCVSSAVPGEGLFGGLNGAGTNRVRIAHKRQSVFVHHNIWIAAATKAQKVVESPVWGRVARPFVTGIGPDDKEPLCQPAKRKFLLAG